jgi:hypothetical protein
MADDSKKEIKWIYVLLGLGLIAYHFFPKGDDLTPDDLSSKTVTLNNKIENIHNTRTSDNYQRFWTKETKAAFTIGSPGEVLTPDGAFDSLKNGDILNIEYAKVHDDELNNGVKEIPIYYLQKGKRVYFELNSYNKVQDAADARVKVIAPIVGILLLLYGFNVVNKKYTLITAGAGVVVFVILRAIDWF